MFIGPLSSGITLKLADGTSGSPTPTEGDEVEFIISTANTTNDAVVTSVTGGHISQTANMQFSTGLYIGCKYVWHVNTWYFQSAVFGV